MTACGAVGHRTWRADRAPSGGSSDLGHERGANAQQADVRGRRARLRGIPGRALLAEASRLLHALLIDEETPTLEAARGIRADEFRPD